MSDPYAHLRQAIASVRPREVPAEPPTVEAIIEPVPENPAADVDTAWAHELIRQGYSPEHVERRTGVRVEAQPA